MGAERNAGVQEQVKKKKTDIMAEIFGDKLRHDGSQGSMRDRCSVNFKLFCEYYLEDSFPSPWSHEFHDYIIDKLVDITLNHEREETKTVVASPRGHAKSTIVNFAYTLWLICYNYKKFIVIISATGTVAKQFLINIRTALEYNPRIRNDFGNLVGQEIWNNSEILTSNKVFIASRSAGTQVRGLNFNNTRPDTIILDDLETPEQVASPTQTADLEKWFNSDVLPMGSTTADFFYIGTVLSYESLLYHMLTQGKYSSWTRKRFQAVINFSRSPLWGEWEEIMTDLERGDSAYNDANKFYEEHKEEMLEGTEVLWKDQRPNMYKYLMEKRLGDEESFASEYMNDPQTENTRVFKTDWLEDNYYVDPPEIAQVSIAIDPAVSGKRKNDFSCIMVVARAKNNYFYVLEADLQKRTADVLIDDARQLISQYYKYNPKVVVETNQMQQFFSTTLHRDFIKAGMYLDWIEVYHSGSKDARIKSLVPHIRNGYVKFKESQKILLSQLRNYPKAHDDGVDALEMALKPLLDTANNKFSFGGIGSGEPRVKEETFLDKIKKQFKIHG